MPPPVPGQRRFWHGTVISGAAAPDSLQALAGQTRPWNCSGFDLPLDGRDHCGLKTGGQAGLEDQGPGNLPGRSIAVAAGPAERLLQERAALLQVDPDGHKLFGHGCWRANARLQAATPAKCRGAPVLARVPKCTTRSAALPQGKHRYPQPLHNSRARQAEPDRSIRVHLLAAKVDLLPCFPSRQQVTPEAV